MHSALALLALSGLATAVKLADFTPRVSNLPGNCYTQYNAAISGCSNGDFANGGKDCSVSCIAGLVSITAAVQLACTGSVSPGGGNVLQAFLAGQGVARICLNADTVLGAESSSAAAAAAASSTVQASTSTSATPTSTTTTAAAATSSTSSTSSAATSASSAASSNTSASGSATSAASSSTITSAPASSSSGLLVASSSHGSSSAAATTSSSSNENHSGGGSPFDYQPLISGADSRSITLGLGVMMLSAVLLATV